MDQLPCKRVTKVDKNNLRVPYLQDTFAAQIWDQIDPDSATQTETQTSIFVVPGAKNAVKKRARFPVLK